MKIPEFMAVVYTVLQGRSNTGCVCSKDDWEEWYFAEICSFWMIDDGGQRLCDDDCTTLDCSAVDSGGGSCAGCAGGKCACNSTDWVAETTCNAGKEANCVQYC